MQLKAEGLVKIYHGRTVVNKVTFEISPGTIVGLLGPNGAGKTTTFKIVIGAIKPEQGRVLLDQEDITELPMYLRARKGIGYLPQEASIFRKLTVRENILSILETLPIARAERERRLNDLLTEFGILHVKDNWGTSLSGGERRRVEIARSLVIQPKFLLVDEPFAGIDPIAIADLKKLIKQLKNKSIGILVTDHNVRDTLEICDFAFIINNGELIVSGDPDLIIHNELARKIYLGSDFKMVT